MNLSKSLKSRLKNFLIFAPAIGILQGLKLLPRFWRQLNEFENLSGKRIPRSELYPCLLDATSNTPFDAHYFYQAGWLARQLATKWPSQHVDIASDVRIFNVLSAFIPTECVDFRPLDVYIPGLTCSAGDVAKLERNSQSIESLSCLHVVEHIGLGRYGERIDPYGANRALKELERVIRPRGNLYLSVPVGRERICFNAHRVFDPHTIINSFTELTLVEMALVDDNKSFIPKASISMMQACSYGCGLFVFTK
jgi:hypothetical protein